MDDPFEAFITSMINDKNWGSDLAEEAKDLLKIDLKNRLLDQIDRAVIEAMPEDKVDEFNDLLDREPSDEEVQSFVESSGVDAKRVTAETMLRFRSLYLADK